ncbi:imidazole glycerol phosphate synthase subunit HisF [Pedobacter flavus]|uniref:Imidazole glycerol phosphate synthase subunit HisF n=1 Tax=Pedobacter flavus TaxID=3113906 RepID=A0ABU7H3P3_9SPHI|nr:imidazole glycerol phosphate synthase subunit HisF [Pedobacter sp. VNH31]MEE1885949.1 imidazole glycerol phosphate synthase subunit HisF [Pedobacter sp. VNH31]
MDNNSHITNLTKRIIACLDVKVGRTVKGVNFEGLKDAGDPVQLAEVYSHQGADELVFLDISATNEKRKTMISLAKEVARVVSIPFTIGGGISSLKDAGNLLEAGADKISINSAAVKNPILIEELAKEFGSQFVVVAADSKQIENSQRIFLNGGTLPTDWNTIDWLKKAESLGAGEILLTSMDKDGTKNGFDIPTLKIVCETLKIPVIASGGAGSEQHFIDVFKETNVDAALAASVFHFREINIPILKKNMLNNNIPVRI